MLRKCDLAVLIETRKFRDDIETTIVAPIYEGDDISNLSHST